MIGTQQTQTVATQGAELCLFHKMKSCEENTRATDVSGQIHASAISPIRQEAGRAAETMWMLLRREKSFIAKSETKPAGFETEPSKFYTSYYVSPVFVSVCSCSNCKRDSKCGHQKSNELRIGRWMYPMSDVW
jgi:hypothetical protein